MTPGQQIQFVKELTANVAEEICNNIRAGKIPDNWDGIELRWYLADRFSEVVLTTSYKKGQKRHRDYKNTVIVENL